jgi:hypothetical protein
MIRKLKVLMLAAMALAAIGVVNVAGAQAAVEFHCSVEPCTATLKSDGTGKTAHHVIVIKNSIGESNAITCESLSGEATSSTKTTGTLAFKNLKNTGCKDSLGSGVTIHWNGCEWHLVSAGAGGVHIWHWTNCTKVNGVPDPVEITISTGCIFKISEQSLTGPIYHNIGEEAKTTTELTVEIKAPNIAVTAVGTKAQCGLDPAKTPITGEYTTGNSLITAETDPGGVMANAWWI